MAYPKLTPVVAAGSTAPRYVADRFADTLSVKDFGAVGDGVTDDSAALTAALAAGGNIIFEKNKTYRFDSHIYVTGAHLNICLNGSTLSSPAGKWLILSGSNPSATGNNGTSLINISHGVFNGCGLGLAHNYGVTVKDVHFANTNGQHHIQIFASSTVIIDGCHFSGLKASGDSLHFEAINIDPGDHTAFPYFPEDSVTYDGTKNSDIFIRNCVFLPGGGEYANLECAVGTHYDDGTASHHNRIFVTNCVMLGISKWAIRANSWKESKISDCYIETSQFALDTGYQKRSENISFINNTIVQNYSVNQNPPIHIGPCRCGNLHIENITYKDTSNTNPTPANLTQISSAAAGVSDTTFAPSRSGSILPIRGGSGSAGAAYSSLGDASHTWGNVYANEVDVKDASPYIRFTETDVEKNVAPSNTGYQGIYFQDKNDAAFGSIIFQTQASDNKPYNTISLRHAGNKGTDSEHRIFFREDANDVWSFMPDPTNTVSLGKSGYLWSEVYASNTAINSSDEKLKDNIESIPESVMRAWGKVNFNVFQFKDAIEKKGAAARLHVGVIAQRVAEAFASEGLDATRFSLFCYDEWPDEYEDRKVVDVEAVLDENGNIVEPEQSHVEHVLVHEGGSQYGIRYGEALALECAYQRWRLEQIEAQLSALTNNS